MLISRQTPRKTGRTRFLFPRPCCYDILLLPYRRAVLRCTGSAARARKQMRRENHDRHQTPPSGLCAAYVHDGLRLCGPCRDAGRGCRRARGQLDGECTRRDKAQQHVHPRHARQLHAERRYALHFPVSGCEHRHAAQVRLPLSRYASGARKALRSGDARAQAQHRQMPRSPTPRFPERSRWRTYSKTSTPSSTSIRAKRSSCA